MIRARNLKVLMTVLLVTGLTACGASYNVTKLDGTEIPKILPHEGIYYSLPKTEVVLRMPVDVTKTMEGRLYYEFEDNVKNCRSNSSYQVALRPDYEQTWKTQYKHAPGRIDIFTRAIPDPNHRYRLDVDAKTFSSFSHTVEVTSSGLLSSADSTVNDVSAEVALSVAKSVTSLARIPAGSLSLSGAATSDPNCADFTTAANKLDAMKKALETIESTREDLLLGRGLDAEPDSLQKALDFLDARIAKIEKANKKTLALTQQTKKTSKFVLFGAVVPVEFAELNRIEPEWRAVALVPTSRKAADAPTLPNVPGASLNDTLEIVVPDELEKRLDEWDLRISVTPSVTYAAKCGTAESEAPCVDVGGGGYRYRVAVAGTVVVDRQVTDQNGNTGRVEVATANVPVAQFGPIAQLPNSFGGTEGNIVLSVFTDTGAMKKITVGGKSQSPESITSATGILVDFLAQRELKDAQKKSDREAVAKEAANAELNELTREKKVLELKKAIRDLKADLAENDGTETE